MSRRAPIRCPQREAVEALSRDALAGQPRRDAQAHLADCDSCRAFFRKLTGEYFPRMRQYTIVERVDEGGFGIVYKAVHHDKKRTEALKVLFGETEERAAFFENEVRLVARLSHPNIATLYEAHLSSPPLYYCMEFVDGQRLDRFLETGSPTLAERVRIVRSVADAIGYAHAQGVVHRDIKPQNIIIDPAGNPRIVDFGIARRLGLNHAPHADPATPPGPIGTLGYMAPEQGEGRAIDGRADIYSLGALLYHAVSGSAPRRLKDTARLPQLLAERRIPRADDLGAVIRKCLAPRPDQRYSDCAALVADLDNYLAGWPTAASAGRSRAYRARRIAAYVLRHHPAALAATAVVAVAALLAKLFVFFEARWAQPASRTADAVTLVAFRNSTVDAIRDGRVGADIPGLSADNRKSWRALHARLLERLSRAAPRVVVFDYFLPDCQPEFDPAFLDAVRASSAPVVVGARSFDLNAQPELCPEYRDVISGCGALLAANPADYLTQLDVPVAVVRGNEPPIPSLGVIAMAAFRHPECEPSLTVTPDALEVRYRKRRYEPGELRWLDRCDRIALVGAVESAGLRWTLPGDRLAHARFAIRPTTDAADSTVAYEEALLADDARLAAWCGGRAVLVGSLLGAEDRHRLADGSTVYGSQLQAGVLRELIAGAGVPRFTLPAAFARILAYAALAAAAAAWSAPRVARLPPGAALAAAAVLFGAGLVVVAFTATGVVQRASIEVLLALAAAMTSFAVVAAGAAARERQVQLAPDLVRPDAPRAPETTIAESPPNVDQRASTR